MVDDLADPRFWNDLRVTGTEMTLGYLFGGLSGIALGVLFARWRLAADIFDPFFTGLNSLPRIALAPLLVIWFGIEHGVQGRAGGDAGVFSHLLHDLVRNSQRVNGEPCAGGRTCRQPFKSIDRE
jgi:ABC-type dipeptide/oligopeptide/nickel transport system permease component